MNYDQFKTKYHITLNPQQESAVTRVNGQTLLLAVPGSGKTTVIVSRLGYMIFCAGIRPENILTMTYNVSAAADMKQRFFEKFGEDFRGNIEFRTINGFCAKVIMCYERARNTSAFALIDEAKITRIIRAIYLDMTREYPSESTIREIKTKLVYCKNMMLRPEEIKKIRIGETDFYEFFIKYREYKNQNRIMDYDDQLEFALRILLNNPDILAFFQNKFRYICIDEAQDTSKIQHMIIRLLAKKEQNIFMVGDEDQSIYGFRAAYPQALLEFQKIYPQSKILLMEKNYRSTRDIVTRANLFIKRNKYRHEKNMCTDCQLDIPVKNIILKDCKYQYNYIMKMLEDNDEELAILYRNNDSALPVIDLFEKNGISYRLKENDGVFFSVNTVTDILNVLLFSFTPHDSSLFLDFYYKIGLKIKKDIVTQSLVKHKNSKISFFRTLETHEEFEKWQIKKLLETEKNINHLRRLNSYSAILYILNKMEYAKFIKERGMDDSKIKTLLALANQNPELPLFLERMAALKQIVNSGSSDPDSKVILSTIHSSKGLEYDNVLLIDVRDGIFPSTVIDEQDEADIPDSLREELEEERRLFYVGVTRAKKKLEIFDYEAAYGEKCETALFTRQLLGINKNTKHIEQKKEASALSSDPGIISIEKSVSTVKAKPQKIQKKQNEEDIKNMLRQYKVGMRINHRTYGTGIIEELKAPICRILIDGGDIRSFDIVYCLSNGLISKA